MTAFNQKTPRSFVDCDTDTADLRKHLIAEEYDEWQRAEPMSEAMFDSLLDLYYVSVGSLIALGLPEPGIPAPVPIKAFRKLPVHREVGLALAALAKRPLCSLRLTPTLTDLCHVIMEAADHNYLPWDEGWERVHTANMKKLWTRDELADFPELKQHTSLPLGQTWKSISNDRILVVTNEQGKVQKPPSWKPARLSDLIIVATQRFEQRRALPASAAASPASTPQNQRPPGTVSVPPPPPVAAPATRKIPAFRVVPRSPAAAPG